MPRRPAEMLVLALDIGSSSTRSAMFDEKGRAFVETRASRDYDVHYTADGGAELSPVSLRRAFIDCLRKTLQARHASPSLRKIPIAALGASAFWHGLLGLDRQGRADHAGLYLGRFSLHPGRGSVAQRIRREKNSRADRLHAARFVLAR